MLRESLELQARERSFAEEIKAARDVNGVLTKMSKKKPPTKSQIKVSGINCHYKPMIL